MKDINHNEVKNGDIVIYMCPRYRTLRYGVVWSTSKFFATVLHSLPKITDWKNPFGEPLRVKSCVLADVDLMNQDLKWLLIDNYINNIKLYNDLKKL